MEREKIIAALKEISHQHDEVITVYLYGSHAHGSPRPRSDIDVGILFASFVSDTLKASFGLEAEINQSLDTHKTEVANLNDASLRLRAEVLTTGIRVFSRDEDRRVEFEFNTMREWWDEQAWHELYNRAYFAALKDNFTYGQRRAYQRARQTLAIPR
jgi:predicted nucleotidyltransferase